MNVTTEAGMLRTVRVSIAATTLLFSGQACKSFRPAIPLPPTLAPAVPTTVLVVQVAMTDARLAFGRAEDIT